MKLSIMHLRLLAHCTSITCKKSLVQVTFAEINCRIYKVFTLTIYHSHSPTAVQFTPESATVPPTILSTSRNVTSWRPMWPRGQNFRPRSIRPQPSIPRAMPASFTRKLSSWPSCHSSKSRLMRHIWRYVLSLRKLLLAL